jgi:adenosine kinase
VREVARSKEDTVRIAVTGSIAEDYLMTFEGAFSEVIVPEEIDNLSLSFLVNDLTVQRGGVAANICFGLGVLGLRPLLVGAVGSDFRLSYERWLAEHGVDTAPVRVSQEQHTARFLCTTDGEENQIASFYPGAMTEASEIDLREVAEEHGGIDLVLIGANDPHAMLRHRQDADAAGLPVIADPSQQLAMLDGAQVRTLVDGASYLVSNEYEASLLQQRTGWSDDEVLDRVETRITTRSEKGCVIERAGEPPLEVPAVPAEQVLDPTGVGDAFRAGFLAGLSDDHGLERSAQLGSLIAVHAVEANGPQSYVLERDDAIERFARTYGPDAAKQVAPTLGRLTDRTAQTQGA